MPIYTSVVGSYRHERDTYETLGRFDHPDLHLWPALTRLGCNEIDLLLAEATIGLFAIEMKAHSLADIVQFGCNEWQLRHEEKPSRSPVLQSSRAAQQLAQGLRERGARAHWICATVLWSRIDRGAWESHFARNRRSIELAAGMLFRDDIESGPGIFREALKRVRRSPCVRGGHPPMALPEAEIDELVALLA
ncbi:MAG: nuclease-related domain-containing protein, partial [Armatimonadota bacterium]